MIIKRTRVSCSVVLILLMMINMPVFLASQVITLKDSLFVGIPYGENFQSIEIEQKSVHDSVFLYSAFNLSTQGLVKVYRLPSLTNPIGLKESRSFSLPFDFAQPNDIKIHGDTLIVTSTGIPEIAKIGGFNKYTGAPYFSIVDTMALGWRVWASFVRKDTVYRLISNVATTLIQRLDNGSYIDSYILTPSPMRDQFNIIQGCTIIEGHILAVLTSSPNRIDFFDLENQARFIGRYFAEEAGFQAQGICQAETSDRIILFYGLRFPNKINSVYFPKNLRVPTAINPRPDSTIGTQSVSFNWDPVEGATHYGIRIAQNPDFSAPLFIDTAIVGQVVVRAITAPGKYYWSVKARNFNSASAWSAPRTFSIPSVRTTLFDTLNIFWGEFHAHTELSFDAVGPVRKFYEQARDTEDLDIAVATDHDIFSTEERWELAKAAANDYYSPGKFVTFIGYEWTNDGFERGGHRTVYFPSSDAYRYTAKDTVSGARMSFDDLVTSVRNADGIMIMAHPDYTPANIKKVDPDVQVGVELFGYEGFSFEYFQNPNGAPKQYEGYSAVNAYMNGGVMGAYAVSDAHNGVAGKRGLTAVLADTLTRQSVFQAMKQRRVYATTGPRAKLYFASDSLFMGDEGWFSSSPKTFRISIESRDTIASVTLIRNAQNLFNAFNINTTTANLSFIDFNPQVAPAFYYTRVLFKNGHRMWSTPIFFNRNILTEQRVTREVQSASFDVFPNPSRGAVQVQFQVRDRINVRFRVFDILGREVTGTAIATGVPGTLQQRQIVHDLPNGVYFVEMNTGGRSTIKKFMVMK